MDHVTLLDVASIATQPPALVIVLDGFRVKFLASLLAILVSTTFSSVAAPHVPPPIPPGQPPIYNQSNIKVRQKSLRVAQN